MQVKTNPFEIAIGADKLEQPGTILIMLIGATVSALIISIIGILSLALVTVPFIMVYFVYLFRNPIVGFYTAIVLGFILIGIGRYVPSAPLGLGMDAILILTYIALLFNRFKLKIDWSPANKDITFLAVIWFGYALFELVNPEAKNTAAWFSGRGYSLYLLLIVPLTLMFIDSKRKLDIFFYIWGIFTILVSMKGIMQHFIGVDHWEKAWLDEGNYKTHILFGKLRSFSFLSDAGQFGANQAYSAVVALILSFGEKEKLKKMFFILVALFGLYGMVLSGTRGAISIPLAGLMAFFVLRKNIGVMITGFVFLVIIFVFFKFTTIGQGNDQIRRMRTAFNPEDASLQVRLANQKKLKVYLASRPFGGGIGLGGTKAQKYRPNAFLSQIATDSGYVLTWVEEGVIGLVLQLFILFYTISKASFEVMFRIRDPILKMKMAALIAGMFGIMVANYGNAVLAQMPTSILIYASMAIMLNSEKYDIPRLETASK